MLPAQWNDARLRFLADDRCRNCRGLGFSGVNGSSAVCACVYREAFRACHNRYLALRERISQVWSQRAIEYVADFILMARRNLDADGFALFVGRYLKLETPEQTCRRLRIPDRTYRWRVAAIETTIGRAFSETEPYGLYPPGSYFA